MSEVKEVKMNVHLNMGRKFRAYQKDHYNFVTPDILKLLTHYNLVVEVSSGTPFMGQAVRGVTVYYLDTDGGRFINVGNKDKLGLNKCFSGQPWESIETEALAYAEEALREATRNYEKIGAWL